MVRGELVWKAIERNVALRGDSVAYVHEDRAYSWSQVAFDVENAACSLMRMGVRRKSRVALWGLNSYSWVVCLFACMEVGATAVLANYSYKRDEMAYLLDYSNSEMLVVGEAKDKVDSWAMAQELQSDGRGGLACVPMDGLAHSREASCAEKELLKSARLQVKPSDAAYVIFTSGTTRRPKGVVLSQENVSRMSATVAERMRLSSLDIQVVALAMFHGSGVNACIMPALQAGACSVILSCFSSLKVLETIGRYRCTVFNSVPSLVLLMIRHESFASFDLSSLRCGIWSGGAVPNGQLERIKDCLGPMKVMMAYGQTEATSLSTMMNLDDAQALELGRCGKALEGVELRIADRQSDEPLAPGERGEIQVGGYSRMDGYLGLSEENKKAFTADGWLKTGDFGHLDSSGELWFEGRIDDMIVRAGENVSPAEIEACIADYSDEVGHVKVVGVRSDLLGQEIAAFYTASRPIEPREIEAYLRSKVAKFKIPSYLCQLDEMPQTSSGKADVKKIRSLAEEMAREND